MIKVTCPKCNGTGRIAVYSHVAAGACFSCQGKGFKLQKSTPQRQRRFAISAQFRKTGETVSPVFWIKAKNEAEALRKAKATLSRGNNYDPETVAATEE